MRLHRPHIPLFVLLALGFLATGCQVNQGKAMKKNFGAAVQEDPALANSGNPNQSLKAGLRTASAALSPTEQRALESVVGGMDAINPIQTEDFERELMAQAEELLKLERRGLQVTAQKIALATQMLTQCANKIAMLAPRPGQPLIGSWKGNSCAAPGAGASEVRFEISGDGLSAPYQVSGAFKGQMGSRPDGSSQIAGNPWSGELTDAPSAGSGTLYNPKFHRRGNVYDSCEMDVVQEVNKNPIPEQHMEAMKISGACFRQALVLLSPTMDAMFERMEPQLAQLLRLQMLGLSQ